MKIRKVENLKHKTTPSALFSIISSREFDPSMGPNSITALDPYNYDAGMNFLGILGEYTNHQLQDKNAILICEWTGLVSDNLHYDFGVHKFKEGVLYDFNGSGEFDKDGKILPNNDPRYILSVGSTGLLIVDFDILDLDEAFECWLNIEENKFNICIFMYKKFKFTQCLFHKRLYSNFDKYIQHLKNKIKNRPLEIRIRKREY